MVLQVANDASGRAEDALPLCSRIYSRWAERLFTRETLLGVYVIAAIAAAVSKLVAKDFTAFGRVYPQLQNFVIIRNSFFHLIHGQNLYGTFFDEQSDLYKYSPAFALLIAPIAILPRVAGAILWSLLNALALFAGVWAVPQVSDRKKACVLWFALISLFVSMQDAQSNGLTAGLMMGSWAAQERGNPAAAAGCAVLSIFVKLFGGLGMLPCLLVENARGKLIRFAALWSALLALLPLVVVRPTQLLLLYRGWYDRLQVDRALNLGRSVMGLLLVWLHRTVPAAYVIGVAAAVLAIVLLVRWDARNEFRFRMLAMASVLTWVIVFNYMAEWSTMIIGVTGVAVWFYFQKATAANALLLALTFVLTCLTPTAAMPNAARKIILPNYLEVVPLLLVWLKIQAEMIWFSRHTIGNAAHRFGS